MTGIFVKSSATAFYFLLAITAGAQTPRIDSLKRLAAVPASAKERAERMLAVCVEQYSMNPDTVYQYATTAKVLALSVKDMNAAGRADFYIVSNLLIRGQTDHALKLADSMLKSSSVTGDNRQLYIDVSLQKGRALNNLNRSKEGLDIFFHLLADAEKDNDDLTKAKAMNGIVNAYVTLARDEDAQAWCRKAAGLAAGSSARPFLEVAATAFNNLGVTNLHLYENSNNRRYLDSAARYIAQAQAINIQNQFLGGEAYSAGIKGTLLAYQGKTAEGEASMKESLQLYRQTGNRFYIINAFSVLGNFYVITKQPEKGIAACKEGIALNRGGEINFFLYSNLAENYKLAKDYAAYGETMRLLVNLKDSLYQKNSAEELSKIQGAYEMQKRENTIIQQKLDLNRKNNLLYGSLGLLVLTFTIGYVVLAIGKKNRAIRLKEMQLAEKRKTMREILSAEENERRRIAADLHDSVAQKMVAAKINLEAFEDYLPVLDSQQQKVYDNIFSLVEDSCTDVRDLSHSMMPRAFFTSGLPEAIRDLVEKVHTKNLEAKCNIGGIMPAMDNDRQIMIYRIVQESVQNVLKHAKATALDISLYCSDEDIDVTIEDNGVGFNSSEMTEGAGMKNIRSRTDFLGGTADISSRPGKGTSLAFHFPVKQS